MDIEIVLVEFSLLSVSLPSITVLTYFCLIKIDSISSYLFSFTLEFSCCLFFYSYHSVTPSLSPICINQIKSDKNQIKTDKSNSMHFIASWQ